MNNWSRARLGALAEGGYVALAIPQSAAPKILIAELPAELSEQALLEAAASSSGVFSWAVETLGVTTLHALRNADIDPAIVGLPENGTVASQLHNGVRMAILMFHQAELLSPSELQEATAAILAQLPTIEVSQIEPLSPRELAYLRKAAAGDSDEEIAEDLNLSMRSVKERKKRSITDLGAVNITHAIILAKRSGQI